MVILLVFVASGPLFGQRAVQNLPFTYKEDFSAIPVCQTCTAPPNYFQWQNNVTIQGWHIENNGGHPTNSGHVFSPSEYNNTGFAMMLMGTNESVAGHRIAILSFIMG